MKKGFTLIELLGVIIIISLIILIIMPNIINAIKKSNKNTSNITADLVYSATKKYIESNDKYKESEGVSYCITIKELVNDGLLDTPIKYGDDNNIENTKSVKATYTTTWNYSIVNTPECVTDANFICKRTTTIGNNTVTSGYVPQNKYGLGDEYVCSVDDTHSYHFFILSVNGSKVSLIADRNLQDDGTLTNEATNSTGWAPSNNNTIGPITAYSYMSVATSNWTKIPVISNFNFIDKNKNTEYGYSGINVEYVNDEYITKIYTKSNSDTSFTNMKVRLPLYNEMKNAGCTDQDNSCPEWLSVNIGADKDVGYWLLDSAEGQLNRAYFVTYNVSKLSVINTANNTCGIRPVIELDKSDLE